MLFAVMPWSAPVSPLRSVGLGNFPGRAPAFAVLHRSQTQKYDCIFSFVDRSQESTANFLEAHTLP